MLIGIPLNTGQAIFLALMVLSVALVLWGTRRRVARSQRQNAPRPREDTDVRDVRQTMERLLIELHDVSREMNARLDTKISVLNNLVREADERIAQMKALAREARPAASDTLRSGGPGVSGQRDLDTPGPDTPRGRTPEPHDRTDPPRRHDRPAGRYAEIYALADQGLDAQQIAEKTGQHTGEVELILGLRAKRPE